MHFFSSNQNLNSSSQKNIYIPIPNLWTTNENHVWVANLKTNKKRLFNQNWSSRTQTDGDAFSQFMASIAIVSKFACSPFSSSFACNFFEAAVLCSFLQISTSFNNLDHKTQALLGFFHAILVEIGVFCQFEGNYPIESFVITLFQGRENPLIMTRL